MLVRGIGRVQKIFEVCEEVNLGTSWIVNVVVLESGGCRMERERQEELNA